MKQKVWFVTGASKGFGLEIVKNGAFARDKVIATVRNHATALQDDLGNPENLLVVTGCGHLSGRTAVADGIAGLGH